MSDKDIKEKDELWDDDDPTRLIYSRTFINDLLGKDDEDADDEDEGYFDDTEPKKHIVRRKKKKSRKKLWLIPIIIALLLIIFCAVTYFVLPSFMVDPNFNRSAYNQMRQTPAAKLVNINSKYQLSGWFIDYTGTNDLIIYFGGISEDASTSALRFYNQQLSDKIYSGYDVAVIDWPEYGNSKGKANETSLKEAAVLITKYFSSKDDVGKVVIIGYSMGTGPAVYAASQVGCSGLILLSPYYNANDLYNNVINIFHGPMELLQSYKMPTNEFAHGVKVRPLIVASQIDERVPYDSSARLAGEFSQETILRTLESTPHGQIPEDPQVLAYIKKYLNR